MNTLKLRCRIGTLVPGLLLVLAACGGDAPESAPPATPADAGSAPSAESSSITVTFESVGEFIAEGAMTLRRDGQNIVADIIADSHLGPGDYPIHIHEGTCEEGGRVVQSLTTMTGGEGGEGTSLTTFPGSQLTATGTYFVQMHRSDGTPIACANIPPLANF